MRAERLALSKQVENNLQVEVFLKIKHLSDFHLLHSSWQFIVYKPIFRQEDVLSGLPA